MQTNLHWFLLVVDLLQKQIYVVESMAVSGKAWFGRQAEVMTFLGGLVSAKLGGVAAASRPFTADEFVAWPIHLVSGLTQAPGSNDCALFTLTNLQQLVVRPCFPSFLLSTVTV